MHKNAVPNRLLATAVTYITGWSWSCNETVSDGGNTNLTETTNLQICITNSDLLLPVCFLVDYNVVLCY